MGKDMKETLYKNEAPDKEKPHWIKRNPVPLW
jgi:hypothetical protein